MIVFIIFILFLLILFLLNEYYFHIILRNTQENQIIKGKKGKNYEWIAFGSSYCRYGLYSGDDEVGFNFGVAAQFLYYSDKMLREYAVSCLKNKGTVFLIIAYLVFAEVGRGLYKPDRYQLLLSKESLGDEYSRKKKIKLRLPLLFCPLKLKEVVSYMIKRKPDRYSSILNNSLTMEQAQKAANNRCESWCKQFGLKDTTSTEIPALLKQKFAQSRDILTGMIQFCYDNGFNPILVVTPVSGILNEKLGRNFMEKVLYDNIKLANKQGAPLLDYLKDDRFQDISLYHNNADFLNARGRQLFTKVLMDDADVVLRKQS